MDCPGKGFTNTECKDIKTALTEWFVQFFAKGGKLEKENSQGLSCSLFFERRGKTGVDSKWHQCR